MPSIVQLRFWFELDDRMTQNRNWLEANILSYLRAQLIPKVLVVLMFPSVMFASTVICNFQFLAWLTLRIQETLYNERHLPPGFIKSLLRNYFEEFLSIKHAINFAWISYKMTFEFVGMWDQDGNWFFNNAINKYIRVSRMKQFLNIKDKEAPVELDNAFHLF